MASFALGRGVFARVVVCVGVGSMVAIFLLGGGAARGSGAGGSPSSWVRQRAASPAGSLYTSLDGGVVCVGGCVRRGWAVEWSRAACQIDAADRAVGRVALVRSAESRTGGGSFVGVSCSSARACMATGEDSKQSPFVERWDGSRWSIRHLRFAGGNGAGGVTCRSVGGVRWSAEGRFGIGTGSVGRSNRKEKRGDLGAITCRSETMCVAVGSAYRGWPSGGGLEWADMVVAADPKSRWRSGRRLVQ